MNRRNFLATATVAVVCARAVREPAARAEDRASGQAHRFHLKYSPHFGMFRNLAGDDLVDQLKFAADQGFTGWEDNEMKDRPVAVQERVGRAMHDLGIEWGVISALRGVWDKVNFAGDDREARAEILRTMAKAVETARRVNARRMTVVPGLIDPKLAEGYQTGRCVDLLRQCCDLVEPHGITMVIEPLNRHTDHPGVFLHTTSQGYALCKAVGRPSCKILFDIYHEQISEGNLIPNIDLCWDEIGYFQCGDNPGRNEPGTGEINYRNIFRHIYEKGYRGVVGMEHGNARPGADGERAVIAAYREVDAF